MIKEEWKVKPEQLRWQCCPDVFEFETTDNFKAPAEIIGQQRAVDALKLGLTIKAPGYNIFISGLSGTGKTSAVKLILEEITIEGKELTDKCYVYNFKNPDMPKLLVLTAGRGRQLQHDMEGLVNALRGYLPEIFESKDFQDRRDAIIRKHREKEAKMFKEFEESLEKQNFKLIRIQVGPYIKPDIVPLIHGQPVDFEEIERLSQAGKLTKEQIDRIHAGHEKFHKELDEIMRRAAQVEEEIKDDIKKLEEEFGRFVAKPLMANLKAKYEEPPVREYLDDVEERILMDIDRFKSEAGKEGPSLPFMPPMPSEDKLIEYQVNVLVDNTGKKSPPVILETSPTYKNLFGTIETVVDRMTGTRTDHTRIKAGSLLRADGGYLAFNALDALTEPGVWKTLKRTLTYGIMEIQIGEFFPFVSVSAMKPEPIELDVKVVMIGDPMMYYLLYHYDEDFKKIFKIKADFDYVMEKNSEHISKYANFVNKLCTEEGLLPFNRKAVAQVVEYGVRTAGKQKKLSAKFSDIADLIREANFWAKQAQAKVVTDEHVEKTLEMKRKRLNLIEDKLNEMILDDDIMIETTGRKVGQVNGLAVYSLGDYEFGKPSKITAEVSMGRSGIINIEREAKLSGKTHDKGVLIFSGYLRGKFAQEKPLTLSASICFEQSYSGVEGDSASSTELYALLSSLSDVPIKQNIAVTGSVNQKGEIQAIGGVNQKIEGFFNICKQRGLTGDQGVIIPHQNVDDLMLREDVVEAVGKGQFHIYAIKTIDEGIEILTDVKAGQMKENHTYPKGTINYLVSKRLEKIAKGLKEFAPEGAAPSSQEEE